MGNIPYIIRNHVTRSAGASGFAQEKYLMRYALTKIVSSRSGKQLTRRGIYIFIARVTKIVVTGFGIGKNNPKISLQKGLILRLVTHLNFQNPITLDTEFVMVLLNCVHGWSFNQTKALVNFWIIPYIQMSDCKFIYGSFFKRDSSSPFIG